jgi:AmmeMemoRadiSam system protein B
MEFSKEIRPPAVAGFFYPRNADALASDIDNMIESAGASTPAGSVRVLVSPHAGYRYSGQVAAQGYRIVRGKRYHTAVVISPSHVEHFDHSAVYPGGGYETPLGIAKTSEALSRRMASVNDRVIASARGHEQGHLMRQEHALEVQIPFLQQSLGGFELVAVVMGDQSWDNCVALGEALRTMVDDPGVLIVASTDLSHFYNAAQANRLDREFREVLSGMDPKALYNAVGEGRCEACGAGPVIAALMATDELRDRAFVALDLKNSGDVTGDLSSVVGYLSAVITAA